MILERKLLAIFLSLRAESLLRRLSWLKNHSGILKFPQNWNFIFLTIFYLKFILGLDMVVIEALFNFIFILGIVLEFKSVSNCEFKFFKI